MSGRIADLTEAIQARATATRAAMAALDVARARLAYCEEEERTARVDLGLAYAEEVETMTAELERLRWMVNR